MAAGQTGLGTHTIPDGNLVISKLPRWVWGGAFALAFVAGMVNAVGLLGLEHQAISHVTGTSSWLANAIAEQDGGRALHFLAILTAFAFGAMVSGLLIADSVLKLGRRYGVALMLEAILLGLAVPLLQHGNDWGIYAASCACGMQNAMASTFSGAVVRTTHLSGIITDLGILFGHALRGLPFDKLRFGVYFLLVSAFLGGGVGGAWAYQRLGFSALFIPCALTAVAGVSYSAYRLRH